MSAPGSGELLLKVLHDDGSAYHGGSGRWGLPTRNADGTWTPGRWMPALRRPLDPCQHGYHLCRVTDLVQWLGPAIYAAEYAGERIDAADKVVVRRARLLRRLDGWDARTARLFAVDCAERVLPLFERRYPNDQRPRAALAVARRHAEGAATEAEQAAAGAAAGDATRATRAAWAAWAAGDAAWAATRAAGAAAGAAAGDAWAAAGAAAWAAARAAAWAAWAAGDAAWAATRAAAGAAAGDAWAAAGAAAWAATRAAAWAAGAAAGAAERAWQTQRLCALLGLPAPEGGQP